MALVLVYVTKLWSCERQEYLIKYLVVSLCAISGILVFVYLKRLLLGLNEQSSKGLDEGPKYAVGCSRLETENSFRS